MILYNNDIQQMVVLRDLASEEKAAKRREEKAEEESRRKWIEEQEKDPRLKVCEEGHCFSHLERQCEWCCGSGKILICSDKREMKSLQQ